MSLALPHIRNSSPLSKYQQEGALVRDGTGSRAHQSLRLAALSELEARHDLRGCLQKHGSQGMGEDTASRVN